VSNFLNPFPFSLIMVASELRAKKLIVCKRFFERIVFCSVFNPLVNESNHFEIALSIATVFSINVLSTVSILNGFKS